MTGQAGQKFTSDKMRGIPLRKEEVAIPYDFINHPEYAIENLVMEYFDKKKAFERDRILLEKPDLITKPFQNAINAGKVNFSATKDCENYPPDTKYAISRISKKLRELGAVRTGIAVENVDWTQFNIKPYGTCFWNYEINEHNIRILPTNNGAAFVISYYEPKFIDLMKNAVKNPEMKGIEFDKFQVIDIDPMTKKERLLRIHSLRDLDELERLISK
jgi:hypothetical protein